MKGTQEISEHVVPDQNPKIQLLKKMLGRLWQNKLSVAGGLFMFLLIIMAVFANFLAPYDPAGQNYSKVLEAPSVSHWFGTDNLGRDIFSRIIYGAQVSLKAGLISVGIALAIGLPIGLFSGYYRGFWDDLIIMRFTDAMLAFPPLVLALTLAAILGAGLENAMIAIGLVFTPNYIRLMRGEVLAKRENEYVEAAKSSGLTDWRIMLFHILPNSLGPIIVLATLNIAGAIIAEASLSFLGLGTQPPTPSWGAMLAEGQGYLSEAPWLVFFPGLFIFLAVMSINLFGDGLQDMLNPKGK
ncbi:ABC transporter permease [Virgibacillus siamensis]|uniref:ABC transporter permease n=1 Tax=Virgibacillus siamensis TaxID=480071 RepID=UPI0009841007|nr:ABC transporter permease [Virgibacillus siamensis]